MPAAEAPGSLRKGNDGFLWRSTMCGLNYRWQPSKAPLIGTLGRQTVDEAKAHTTGVSQEGIDDACGGEQALPAAAAAAPQAECTNRRPVWAFDTAWGWKQVKKRTVDGKLGYWHHKHSGPDKGRTLSLGTKVAYTKDKPAGPPTEATPTFAGQGDKQWFYGGWVVEPRWVQLPAVPIERRGLSRRWDSRTRARDGSEWVQVRHNKQQRMFVFTRGDREMVLRKGASVVCTEATPTGAAAHSTYEFPGYVDWKKRPMEAARKRLNNYDWLRKAAPRKRPQAGGTAPPDAKKARSGGGEAEPASKARPTQKMSARPWWHQEGTDACGCEQASPAAAAAAAAPQAECTADQRPLWAFDTAWGWRKVKKRQVDGKLGYWRRQHSGPDEVRTLSLGAKVAYTKDRPAGPPTEATPTFAGHGGGGGIVEPRWVQDGGEWVQVSHHKRQRRFVFTRGDEEVGLRKGASVVCALHKPPVDAATAHPTYEFPGYYYSRRMPINTWPMAPLTRRQVLIASRALRAAFKPQNGKKYKEQMAAEQVGGEWSAGAKAPRGTSRLHKCWRAHDAP
jgi:hypothetical protein